MVCLLRELLRTRRKISVSDRLLFLAPLFLLLGFFRMEAAVRVYEQKQDNLRQCLSEGKELLVTGQAAGLSFSKDGVSFQVINARAASYAAEQTVYREVGRLMVYSTCEEDGSAPVKEGQQVFLFGRGSEFLPAENPGQFDARQYYFSKKITGALTASKITITNSSYHRLNQALFLVKKRMEQSLSDYLSEKAGVISSMLLGERALLSEETGELYRRGGISHILAISGLHVTMFGAAVYAALRKSLLGRNGAIPAAGGCMILYGMLVNAGVSTKRAIIMFLLLLLATVLGRTYDTLSAMSFSGMVLLLESPGALFTSSFQLSYAAAYAASVFFGILTEKEVDEESGTEQIRQGFLWGLWKKGRETLQFGLAIALVSLPLTVYHFYEFPLYGFAINPVVVPLLNLLLSCAILSAVLGMVFPAAGIFFAGTVRAILSFYEFLCEGVTKLPFPVLLFGQPKLWQMALYYGLLLLGILWWKRARYRERQRFLQTGEQHGLGPRGYLLLLAVLPVCLLPVPTGGAEVAVLSVGQGDGIVITEGTGLFRTACLVDGGSSSVTEVGQKRLLPYLRSQGIGEISCAFVSHIDEDHLNGLKELLLQMEDVSKTSGQSRQYSGRIQIRRLVLPEAVCREDGGLRLMALAETKGVEVILVSAGDRITLGKKTEFTCISPQKENAYEDRNSASLVLLMKYGQFTMLLTGDATKETEQDFLASYGQEFLEQGRGITVLKAGHHGSDTSTSEELLRVLRPELTVISCGRKNRYGHPHRETMERLEACGTKVFRTDVSGAILFSLDQKGRIRRIRKGAGKDLSSRGF